MNLREVKQVIRAYMRSHYSDQNLADALCHARDGKLTHNSCCCFVGLPSADHALRVAGEKFGGHLGFDANSDPASLAFCFLAGSALGRSADVTRRRRLIPMLLAEMRRRERWLTQKADQEDGCHVGIEERA
jgi:hypothetical protein